MAGGDRPAIAMTAPNAATADRRVKAQADRGSPAAKFECSTVFSFGSVSVEGNAGVVAMVLR